MLRVLFTGFNSILLRTYLNLFYLKECINIFTSKRQLSFSQFSYNQLRFNQLNCNQLNYNNLRCPAIDPTRMTRASNNEDELEEQILNMYVKSHTRYINSERKCYLSKIGSF